jgi:hypothetical protein
MGALFQAKASHNVEGGSMSIKDDVRQEYEDLKNHFRNTNFEDF